MFSKSFTYAAEFNIAVSFNKEYNIGTNELFRRIEENPIASLHDAYIHLMSFARESSGLNNIFPDEIMIKTPWKRDKITRIKIGTKMSSRKTLFQKINIFVYQTFYSDGTKIQNYYDDSTLYTLNNIVYDNFQLSIWKFVDKRSIGVSTHRRVYYCSPSPYLSINPKQSLIKYGLGIDKWGRVRSSIVCAS